MGRSGQKSRDRSTLWAIILLVGATWAVYLNSLNNQFLFDDVQTIVEAQSANPQGLLSPLLNLLKGAPSYRPLRSASYAFDYALSGLNPVGYHLSNVTYHTLSSLTVLLIARTIFGKARPALITALLFALHPIQTDSVTYLSGRRDVLSGLFVLVGFYSFLRYRLTEKRGYLIGLSLSFILAFFSKESGIILPLLCFAYDSFDRSNFTQWENGVSTIRRFWAGMRTAIYENRVVYLSFFAGTGAFAFYVLFLVRGTWQQTYHGGSLWFTLLTDARIFVHYLKQLVFPITLNADYSYNAFPVTVSWTDQQTLIAILVLFGIGVGCYLALNWRPLVTLGGLWFFLALLPVAQIIPHHEMMAEHYLYVPSFGFFLSVVAIVDPYFEPHRSKRLAYGVAAVVLVLLSLRTIWRNTDWKDELTLWQKTVQVAPDAARARNNLGAALLRQGQSTEAMQHLERAVSIKPDFAIAHANIGKVHLDRNELDLAAQKLHVALELNPKELLPRLWLGAAYIRQGQEQEAEEQFRMVLATPSLSAYAYNNLGVLFVRRGQMTEAQSAFESALSVMPNLAAARENMARLTRMRVSGELEDQGRRGSRP
jgi:predicted negative regulator of RcsB-dependent stress response